MLQYKAERAGCAFVAVDAKGTSQQCSGCGAKVKKDLSVRIHKCSHCNLDIHRDLNAARTVLIRAVVGPWSGRVELPDDLAGDRRSMNLKAA
jgi:putative transposase